MVIAACTEQEFRPIVTEEARPVSIGDRRARSEPTLLRVGDGILRGYGKRWVRVNVKDRRSTRYVAVE